MFLLPFSTCYNIYKHLFYHCIDLLALLYHFFVVAAVVVVVVLLAVLSICFSIAEICFSADKDLPALPDDFHPVTEAA